MRCLFLFFVAGCCLGWQPAAAQTSTDLNEGVRVTADATTGAQVLTWWGKAGRTYFVQQSFDLIHWTYVPVVRDGAATVDGLNFASTDSRQFWRLQYTDASTGGLSGAEADFDDDGLSNQEEVEAGTAAFNADTDGDGFSDGTEALAETDPNSATSNPETDLDDVPLLKATYLLNVAGGSPLYYASSNVMEFDENTWTVWEDSIIPGNSYHTLDFVNGARPDLPALPARPTAGSGGDFWGSWFYSGSSHGVSLRRIVDADNSNGGDSVGSYSSLIGTASQYKFVVQYPSRNVRTIKVVERKTEQPVTVEGTPPQFKYGALVVTSSLVRTLTLAANATETAETILQPDEAQANVETTATVGQALFITPAGDPVTGPVDSDPDQDHDPAKIPEGANEFTFSDATAGVLTLKLKVHMPGVVSQSAADQAKYAFDVDAIGSSVLGWVGTAGNTATVSGEYLTATATFTGLPQNNTDFGLKTVRLKFDGSVVVAAEFEVFFDRDATNHPGNGAGSDPNWFYYWGQAAGTGTMNIAYGGETSTNAMGEAVGGTRWNWSAAPEKTKVILYDEVKLLDDQYGVFGDNVRTGIDSFFTVLLHEQRHVKQIADADALLGNLIAQGTPWQFGWSLNTDTQFGLNSNHYTLGNDGKPGVKDYDDDGDGMIDNIIASGRGELGYKLNQINNPPANLMETDDVELELGGNNRIDWPKAWAAPQDYPGIRTHSYIELDAINAAKDHAEDQSAAQDWANPGKNHDTKAYDD